MRAELPADNSRAQLETWLTLLGGGSADYFVFHRHGLPLLALPDEAETFLRTLQLYRPQRFWASAFARMLRLGLSSGLGLGFWPRTPWRPTPTVSQTKVGILFGNPSHRDQRCIFCRRENGRWIAGKFSTQSLALTREAEMLRAAARFPGTAPEYLGLATDSLGAILTMEYRDSLARNTTLRERVDLLGSWLLPSPPRPLADFPSGKRLLALPTLPEAVRRALGAIRLRPALRHGDFASWNVLADPRGSVFAVDWEEGEPEDAPGFDLMHDLLQQEFLVRRSFFPVAQPRIEQHLHSAVCRDYLQACGWEPHLDLLMSLSAHLESARRPSLRAWLQV